MVTTEGRKNKVTFLKSKSCHHSRRGEGEFWEEGTVCVREELA